MVLLRMIEIFVLLISLWSLPTSSVADTYNKQPNFLFILMDDWGLGDVNAYGNSRTTKVQTPNIDRLAGDGILFTNGYSASSVCSPSRTGWMTGRFPAEAAIHSALGTGCAGCAQFLDPAKFPTVPLLLKKANANYTAAHYGKWHLGMSNKNKTAPLPAAYGFDDTATFNSDADTNGTYPGWPMILPGCWSPRNAPSPQCNDTHWAAHTADAIVRHSLDFVDKAVSEKRPWYLNAWFHVSHAMIVPTADQLQAYSYDAACRLGALNSGQTTCAHQIFWSAQKAADASVGDLLDGIRQRGEWTNTIFAFSTDNGPEEMMVYTNGVGSTGAGRGRKRSIYDGGVRLPFIMAAPGRGRKGVIDHSVVGAVDWMPTVLELAGVTEPAPGPQRGYSLVPLLLSNDTEEQRYTERPRDKPLLWEWRYAVAGPCWNDAPQLGARLGRYKLLMDPPGENNLNRLELYDFGFPSSPNASTMLFESQDVSKDPANQEIIANLSVSLLAWHASLPPGPVNPHPGCANINWPGSSNQVDVDEQIIEDDPAFVL